MNELFKKIRSYVIIGFICFIVGSGLAFSITVITIHKRTQNRLADYEKLIESARISNQNLKDQLQSAVDRNRELESTIQQITDSIDRINRSSGKITIVINELDRISIAIRRIVEKYD